MSQAPEPEPSEPGLGTRSYRALGPVLAGVALDAVDLATFGPLGLYAGFLCGAALGYWATGFLRFGPNGRIFWTMLAGIYCTVPMTEFLPIATVMGAASRFVDDRPGPLQPPAQGAHVEGVDAPAVGGDQQDVVARVDDQVTDEGGRQPGAE